MNKYYNRIKFYHDNFEGNTYDACAECGGKCEKYKIATLMPGEKEYMSDTLGIPLNMLEEKYLSRINTPSGSVDVLKMKESCNFLDEEYRCTAIPAKPVNCDSYPIVFSLTKRTVKFEIDKDDCPMVHWRKYDNAVDYFAKKGIDILKQLKIPISWWRTAGLFDEFDVDYISIDKYLSKTGGYEEFYLEKILGYACNGYEKKARKRGLMLMIERFHNLQMKAYKQLDRLTLGQPQKITLLANSYKKIIHEYSMSAITFIHKEKANSEALTNPDPSGYLNTVSQGLRSLKQLEEVLQSFVRRLKAARKYAHGHFASGKTIKPIEDIHPNFKTAIRNKNSLLSFYEIKDTDSKYFWDSVILMARTFLPSEIDSPENYLSFLKGRKYNEGFVCKVENDRSVKKMWNKWIMVCATDEKGKLVGAADGALIVNNQITVFYFSHIAVTEKYRVKGIGSELTAATLQVADQAIPEAWKALNIKQRELNDNRPLLDCEVCEIEFPDNSFAGTNSIKRLTFHGRLQRKVIWPLRYSQPDTDYVKKEFIPEYWNTVPMFLTYRSFSADLDNTSKAIEAADLMFDYFIIAMGEGARWDKAYMHMGLKVDGFTTLIPMPENNSGVEDFISHTGTLPELLKKYFPTHKFTIDFFND